MNPQEVFLRNEFFSMSLLAATRRANIYTNDVPESARRELHAILHQHLEELSATYQGDVAEVEHVKNIEFIANSVTRQFSEILAEGKFRIGPAQKVLNLYLKYLWCAGYIVRPPHCPIDAIILAKAKVKASTPWTKMSSIPEYEEVIEKLKKVAANEPLAEWELRVYNQSDALPFVNVT